MTLDPKDGPVPFAEFRHVIAEQLQVEEARVVREAHFLNDLFADSIQLVEMMLRLEEMGVHIPLESAWEVETVGDAYRLYVESVA
jgi:acyl carrier protein